jgi:2-polyprenyl-6-methoxyphenol hydroxylase-like FAD-dependent oxidoreductase
VSWHFGNEKLKRERLLEHCRYLINQEGWHPNLRTLIHQKDSSELMEPWLLRTTQFPGNEQFSMMPSGRITLLGDAVHSMPPDRGLGGNNVLEDARLLTSILGAPSKNIVWPKVVAVDETQMFARAKKAVEESTKAAKMHILKGHLSQGLSRESPIKTILNRRWDVSTISWHSVGPGLSSNRWYAIRMPDFVY